MHNRPIRVVVGVVDVDVVDEVDDFRMVADNDDGGRMPVGFGNLDDAVEISLLIDLSDGAGDGALCAPSEADSAFVSLIFDHFICTCSSFLTDSVLSSHFCMGIFQKHDSLNSRSFELFEWKFFRNM